MPRRLTANPSNMPAQPNYVSDPVREKEIAAEAVRKMAFIESSYRTARHVFGRANTYNRSLAGLKAALEGRTAKNVPRRLQIEINCVVMHHARKHAAASGKSGPLDTQDVEAGAREAVRRLKPRRGAPADPVLRHHLAGLMAVLQTATAKPLIVTLKKNTFYDPQGRDKLSDFLITFLQRIDPKLATITIVNAMLSLRKEYAGRELRFESLFPAFGVTAPPFDGPVSLANGDTLEWIEPVPPIYFGRPGLSRAY